MFTAGKGLGIVSHGLASDEIPIPGAPIGQILQAYNKSLLIQVSFVPHAAAIKVFRDTDPGGAFPEITASPFTAYEILDDNDAAGLAEDTPYYYKLKAVNAVGEESPFSAVFAGRTIIGKDHPRKAIRDKAVAMLAGKVYLDSTAINVFKTRFLPLYPDELPALGVYIVDEPADHQETAPREYFREPQLRIDIVLAKDGVEDPDDEIDYIAKQVEDLLMINNKMDGLIADLFLTGTTITPKVDGDKIYLGATMNFKLEYYTAGPEEQGAPLVEAFETANTDIAPDRQEEETIEAETELPQS